MTAARRRPGRLTGALLLVVFTTAPLEAARGQEAPPAGVAFSAFGYGETDVRGQVGQAELTLPLSPDRRPAGETVVELDVSHSPLLLASSTLTVLAGGVSVASVALTPQAASHVRVPVSVPAELFGDKGLDLSFRTYLRLTADDCEDDANPALWLTVHATSTVRFGTEPTARALTDVGALLLGPRGTNTVEIAVPPAPDADMLRAAGVVAAQVGWWHAEHHTDAPVGLATSPSTASIVLAAGAATPSTFPVRWDGAGFRTGTTAVGGERGVLALAQDGPPQLLVGGTTPAAVADAAGALGTATGGPVAVLTGERPAPRPAAARPWQDGAASLAQLGVDRQQVTGAGRHDITLSLERPPGWRITGQPQLELVVDSSPTIDPDRSFVQVELAGNDLGSRPVMRGAGPHTYVFDVSPGLLDRRLDGRPVRSLDLHIAILLAPAGPRCTAGSGDSAWAAVLPTSAFRLPHDDAGTREVGRFPYPVARTWTTAGAAVVVPRAPTPDALAAGVQLCAALGRWSQPGVPPPLLVTADQLTAADRERRGLILLGDADAQVFGRGVDVGAPPVVASGGEASAVVGVVASPVNRDRSVLVVHGDGKGLLLVARTLSSRQGVDALRGSRDSVVGDAPAIALGGAGEAPVPPPELAPVLGGGSSRTGDSWAFPAVVLLAGFVVAVFLVARYRWGGRSRSR